MNSLLKSLNKLGNPSCDHKLENGSSAYEWRQYGIEYIKTCSICCDLDYSSRSLTLPELTEKISTDALIEKLASNMITIAELKGAGATRAIYKNTINKLEGELSEIIPELKKRGGDIAKYIKTGEEVIRE